MKLLGFKNTEHIESGGSNNFLHLGRLLSERANITEVNMKGIVAGGVL